MSIEVCTEEYVFTHGSAPRGKGLWMFVLAGDRGATTFEFNGTYGQAKAAAVREARASGCYAVAVQP